MKRIILIFGFLILSSCTSLKEVKTEVKEYHSSGYVNVRGDKQYLTISTENIDKPILLYLHGGPGGALTPLFSYCFKKLEKDFIIVFWDQRGAGKSFNGIIPKKYQTVDSFVEDTKEITEYLLKKFNKDKLFLLGHSWGSMLGINTIKKYPNMYYAFIGTGQLIDVNDGMKVGYDLLLKKSLENKNIELEKQLKSINKEKLNATPRIMNFSTRQYFSLINSEETYQNVEIVENAVKTGENMVSIKTGLSYSPLITNLKQAYLYNKLRGNMAKNNLNKITKLEVPVYFAVGKKDMITPVSLVQEYFKNLESPKKELILFENMGHAPHIYDRKNFFELLIRIKNETLSN